MDKNIPDYQSHQKNLTFQNFKYIYIFFEKVELGQEGCWSILTFTAVIA